MGQMAPSTTGIQSSHAGRVSNLSNRSRYDSLTHHITELDNEESVAVGDGDLDKRWYTLIEIAESPDSESE